MAKKKTTSKENKNKYSSLIPRLVNEFGDERKVSEETLKSKTEQEFEEFIEKKLFKDEKKDWYVDEGEGENKTRTRDGSEEKIKLFWECIREIKMSKEDYDFSGYFFPEFEKYDNIYDIKIEDAIKENKENLGGDDFYYDENNKRIHIF